MSKNHHYRTWPRYSWDTFTNQTYFQSDYLFPSYHLETKYLAILRHKKGHNSSKNCRKIVIIELDLDIHKIHLHAIPSFKLTFHSQVIIWKLIRDTRTKYKKGCNSGKICQKIIPIELDLDIHEIHLQTKPTFNLTICSQVIIWKPNI